MPEFLVTAHETIVHYFTVVTDTEEDAEREAYDIWRNNEAMIMSSSAEWYVAEVTPKRAVEVMPDA